MSADVSGEITAIATAVLAIFAIVTAIFAIRAFRKQSQEVGILTEQHEREVRERHRDQASRVFIWAAAEPPPGAQDQYVPGLIAHIRNTSQQPVYDGFIGYRDGTQWIDGKERTPYWPSFFVLMPGEQVDTGISFADPAPWAPFWKDNSALLTSLRFRDAAGEHWRRFSDGRLEEEPTEQPNHGSSEGSSPASGAPSSHIAPDVG